MPRIRNIKPAFYRSIELYELEIDVNKDREGPYLNMRIAFSGLFTVADVKGRFEWKPRILKLDCLPHDAINFEEILEELRNSGFIQKYCIEGKSYGLIPTFCKHQIFTKKEQKSGSRLPEPTENSIKISEESIEQSKNSTGTVPVMVPERYEVGRRKKEIGNRKKDSSGRNSTNLDRNDVSKKSDFETFWKLYPNKVGKAAACKKWDSVVAGKIEFVKIINNLTEQKKSDQWSKDGGQYIPNPLTYLNQGRWDDEINNQSKNKIVGSREGEDLELKYGGVTQ